MPSLPCQIIVQLGRIQDSLLGPFAQCVSDSVKNYLTIEIYVTVEAADIRSRVNTSIWFNRIHCLRKEKIGVVTPCEWAFGEVPINSEQPHEFKRKLLLKGGGRIVLCRSVAMLVPFFSVQSKAKSLPDTTGSTLALFRTRFTNEHLLQNAHLRRLHVSATIT